MSIVDRLAAARGELPCDLALRNARLVNVISGEIYPSDIAVHDRHVVGLGDGYEGAREVDLAGKFVTPGLIDAHVHIESSLVTPPEFARAVLPHGVTTVITDPHEIANVLGMEGIHYMLEQAKGGQLNIFVMASSCVPATHMETAGAQLEASDLAPLLSHAWVPGLAELMNYPGVALGDEGMLDKLTLFKDRVLDGHAPAMTGKLLNAYAAAGVQSEHECTTVEEAREKLRLGLTIFIREGSTTRNLLPLLPLITAENHSAICFCTDDRAPADLIDEGSIDFMLRQAVAAGIDPVMAIRMGSYNTARHFGLRKYGAVTPGRYADLLVVPDLYDFHAQQVYRGGELVAEDGRMASNRPPARKIDLPSTVNIRGDSLDFTIPARGEKIRVIGKVLDQVYTQHLVERARIVAGCAVSDTERDILKFAMIERHHASGKIGLGFIKGFGLQQGAIAGTVAHDHHNLAVIGVDDSSMRAAALALEKLGGGLVAAEGERILASLPLPVAGLLSEAPIEQVRADYATMTRAAQLLGSPLPDPFMVMSFMGLEVIPRLKLTDHGLVDVERFEVVDLFLK
ncbi:MAG: adenine deaminase [Chloroflexi bacterium]|nr:adenine deaminase [Chloroflexota bacterium]MCY3583425.1 adenine deaminase [Chloroflexota bacterium]MCY3715392.1 adenine deaminase [Chloroflexota bacterium]MDE2649601.1 adenine deaminase [Chloroflexota bacterium]MXV91964.1 adenine deaminase [Chloroflexota bacterium]